MIVTRALAERKPALVGLGGVLTLAGVAWAIAQVGISTAQGTSGDSPIAKPYVYQVWGDEGQNLDIFLQDPSASEAVPIATSGVDEYSPALSPDGKTVAFVMNEQDNADIFTVGVDASGLRRITSGLATDGGPTWSADGQSIAFWRDEGNGLPELYVVAASGGGVRKLTTNSYVDVHPSWSPDGASIALTRLIGDTSNIFVVDAVSGAEMLVTEGGTFTQPHWSPDGTLILAGRSRDGGSSWDVVTVTVASGEVVNIRTDVGALISSLEWVEEGIVVTAADPGLVNLETLLIHPQTGEILKATRLEGEPAW
jgi:Tol biopolymer transport system component